MIAFDVETSGPSTQRNSLMAVGIAKYLATGKSVEYLGGLEVHLEVSLENYEPSTLEFWKTQSCAWEQVKQNTIPVKEAQRLVVEFLQSAERDAEKLGANYRIITDNAWFDPEWINLLLSSPGPGLGLPIRYSQLTGQYFKVTTVIDTNQWVQALGQCGIPTQIKLFRSTIPHDHTPLNDARSIAEKYLYLLQRLRQIKKESQS